MCEWKPDFDGLNERVTKIEGRMEQVEHDMGKMRSETQEGFKAGAAQMNAISAAVTNLGHDFGERMFQFTPARGGRPQKIVSFLLAEALQKAYNADSIPFLPLIVCH